MHPVILRRWGNAFLFLLSAELPDLRFDKRTNKWAYDFYIFFGLPDQINCFGPQLRVCHKLTGKLKREVILGSSSLEDPAQFITVIKPSLFFCNLMILLTIFRFILCVETEDANNPWIVVGWSRDMMLQTWKLVYELPFVKYICMISHETS